MLLKCCTPYTSKFRKLSSGHGIGKGQFSFQSQRWECQRMFKLPTIGVISHASKEMLKILQARLQQYVNWELPDVQKGFRKGRVVNMCWITEKAREFQKNIYFIDYIKTFYYVDHNKLWKIHKELGIPDHLTCKTLPVCRSRSTS